MKQVLTLFVLCFPLIGFAQSQINPVVKSFGGIYEIPYAEEKPDPTLDYNIIVEAVSNSSKYDSINWPLFNVARMINLHVAGGVPSTCVRMIIAGSDSSVLIPTLACG